jgi:hypothetical protein
VPARRREVDRRAEGLLGLDGESVCLHESFLESGTRSG